MAKRSPASLIHLGEQIIRLYAVHATASEDGYQSRTVGSVEVPGPVIHSVGTWRYPSQCCAEPELMVCKLFGHSVSCIPPQSREVTDGWGHTASRAFCRPSSVGCLSRLSSACLQSMGRHIYIKCAEGSSITSRPTINILTLLTQSSRNWQWILYKVGEG